MSDLVLIPQGELKVEDINKAIINLSKQIDTINSEKDKVTVDGVVKTLNWKTFTGTTGGATTTIPHGIDITKRVVVSCMVSDAANAYYNFFYDGANQYYVNDDATNIYIHCTATFQTKPYIVTIGYTD